MQHRFAVKVMARAGCSCQAHVENNAIHKESVGSCIAFKHGRGVRRKPGNSLGAKLGQCAPWMGSEVSGANEDVIDAVREAT